MTSGIEDVKDDDMRDRFFDRDSILWRVDREMVLLLGGGRALLMQLAHPKVAEGVADHSRFRQDPMGRLSQTMNAIWSIIFDEAPEAQASLQRVRQLHRRVRGTIKQGDVLPVGTPYDAQNSDLLLWVHATLVDSALVTYELFVGPIPESHSESIKASPRGGRGAGLHFTISLTWSWITSGWTPAVENAIITHLSA